MKNLIFLSILFASCGTVKYSTQIDHRDVSQRCYFTPHLADKEVATYMSQIPVQGGTYLTCDSIYTLHQTWSQAWKKSNHIEFYSGIAVQASFIGSFAYLTSIATITSPAGVILPVFGILIGGPLTGDAVEWYRWNGDRYITKWEYYNVYLNNKSAQQNFWNATAISF